MMFFPIYLLNIVRMKGTNYQKNILILVIFILILYVEMTTRTALEINANVTRSWGNYSDELRELNIGHYGFVYSIPMVISLLLIAFFKSSSIFIKIIMVALMVTQMGFLLIAQYTLAIFAAFIGMLLLLMIHYSGSKKIVIISIIMISLLPLVPSLIKLAANTVPSESMSIGLYEVYSLFTSGDGSGYNLSSRMSYEEKINNSIFTFADFGKQKFGFLWSCNFFSDTCNVGFIRSNTILLCIFS